MPVSLGELATRFGCDLKGDPDIVVDKVATLANAGPGTVSFLANSKYKQQLSSTKAAVVVLRGDDADDSPAAALINDDPYATYARIATLLHPPPATNPGVHATAVIEANADVAPSAEIAAQAVVSAGAKIGEHVYIGPGSFVGPGCVVGDTCRLVANVTLVRAVTIGRRGIFHPGVVIGSDGFGNAMTVDGWVKVPQVGGVRIGDDVEIGSNSTVDCGAIDDTVIENGVRIDNLCMVGHNVQIGEHTAIASSTAIAGSAVIGKRCMFGGQAGSVGHVSVCDDVVISGRGMVSKDITKPGVYASFFPSEPAKTWNRLAVRFRRLDSLYERVAKLEKNDK